MTQGFSIDSGAPEALALQADYSRRSEEAAKQLGGRLDIPYGPHPRNRLDVFSAGAGAPALVFFHGGYWRAGSKESRRFPAIPWAERGVSWVAAGYRLVPEFSLRDAVEDARAAVAWLEENAAGIGLGRAGLHLAGNSAGAHLAAMAAADGKDGGRLRTGKVRSLSVVSGLFDLVPLLDAGPNDWLKLDAAAARDLSPVHHLPPPDLPVLVAWGGKETREFKTQSSSYSRSCRGSGNPVAVIESPSADHFEIIGEFGAPDSPVFRGIERLLSRSN